MKKTFSLIILITIMFIGCGYTQPNIPKYKINPNDKIGYIIDIPNKVEHYHTGTTIFNNFEKTYKYNWDLDNKFTTKLKKNLSINLIDLVPLGYSSKDISDLIVAKDKEWIVAKTNNYNKLVNELGLKAVILVQDNIKNAFIYPLNFKVKGTGLLSLHSFGLKGYHSILAVKPEIYLLNPVAKIELNKNVLSTIIYSPLMSSSQELSGFNVPIDIENITEEEMEPVKRMNLIFLDRLVEKTIKYIK